MRGPTSLLFAVCVTFAAAIVSPATATDPDIPPLDVDVGLTETGFNPDALDAAYDESCQGEAQSAPDFCGPVTWSPEREVDTVTRLHCNITCSLGKRTDGILDAQITGGDSHLYSGKVFSNGFPEEGSSCNYRDYDGPNSFGMLAPILYDGPNQSCPAEADGIFGGAVEFRDAQ